MDEIGRAKISSERIVKNVRRATRKQYSADDLSPEISSKNG